MVKCKNYSRERNVKNGKVMKKSSIIPCENAPKDISIRLF
jgi:hypothetical protein